MTEETTLLVRPPDGLSDAVLRPFAHAALEIGVERENLVRRIRRAHSGD